MFGWVGRLRIPGILLVLCALIATPALIAGNAAAQHGDQYLAHKDYLAAARSYESAARLLPWNGRLLEQAALAYASARAWDRAMPLLETARGRGVLSADGWDVLGTGYWLELDYQHALEVWGSGLKNYPAQLKFYSRLALAYRGLGDYAAQRQSLERWLPTGQGSAREHYELGQLLMISDPARASQELASAASADAAYAPAVASLRAALDLAANQADESRRLVVIGRGLGVVNEWHLARQAFEQAVRADQGSAEAWAWLGEARQQTGEDGKPQLDAALALGPDATLVHALRGLYWKRQEKYGAALAEYQVAAREEPANPEWQVALGEAFSLKGDLVSALACYQKATTLAPDNAIYWRLLAIFSADNGVQVLDIGLPAAKKAAEITPDDPLVLDTLGWTFAQAGLLYNAERTLDKAAQLAPDLASAHLHLGEMYLLKGDPVAARRELDQARQLDAEGPSGSLAAQLLQQYFP